MAEIAGLKLIVPSSVAGSGVSVSASGKVTFTAATSVSVNGVFDGTYDNYLAVVRSATSALGNNQVRVRASGTDDTSTANYAFQRILANGTSVAGIRYTNQGFWTSGAFDTTVAYGGHFYFYGPALTQPTAWRCVTVSTNGNAILFDIAGTHTQSTSYDGFTFYPNSGNITGTITIYGLSQ